MTNSSGAKRSKRRTKYIPLHRFQDGYTGRACPKLLCPTLCLSLCPESLGIRQSERQSAQITDFGANSSHMGAIHRWNFVLYGTLAKGAGRFTFQIFWKGCSSKRLG